MGLDSLRRSYVVGGDRDIRLQPSRIAYVNLAYLFLHTQSPPSNNPSPSTTPELPSVAVHALRNRGLTIMTMIFRNLDPGSTSEIRQSNNDVKLSNQSQFRRNIWRYCRSSFFEVISNPPAWMEHPCTSPRILLGPHLGHEGFLNDLDTTESGVKI
jgi:hypothetical protein